MTQEEIDVLNGANFGLQPENCVKHLRPVYQNLIDRGFIEPIYQPSKEGSTILDSYELKVGGWIKKGLTSD